MDLDFDLYHSKKLDKFDQQILDLQFSLHSLLDLTAPDNIILSNLEETFRIRHDLLHYTICKHFDIPIFLGTQINLNKQYPFLQPTNLTPDVCFVTGDNSMIIADFAITIDVANTITNKSEKYKVLIEKAETSKQVNKVIFFPFVIPPDLSTLQLNYHKFQEILKTFGHPFDHGKLFDFAQFQSFISEVEIVQNDLRESLGDKNKIKQYFANTYGEKELLYTGTPVKPVFTPENYKKLLSDEYEYMSEEKIKLLLGSVLNDKEVVNELQEKETKPDDFFGSFEKLKAMNSNFEEDSAKPSIYMPIFPCEYKIPNHNYFKSPEQNGIYSLLHFFSENISSSDSAPFQFIKEISNQFLSSLKTRHENVNKALFESGSLKKLFPSWDKIKIEYHKYRTDCKNNSVTVKSFYDWINLNNILDLPSSADIRAVKQKIYKFDIQSLSNESLQYFSKSHVGTKNKNIKIMSDTRKTIPLAEADKIVSFFDKLMQPCKFEPISTEIDTLLTDHIGTDLKIIEDIKVSSLHTSRVWIHFLKRLNIYNFAKAQSLHYEQLMHYLQLSLPNNNFAMFNCGLSNQICLLPVGHQNLGSDTGKAFLTAGVTDDQSFADSVYGKVFFKQIQVEGKKLYIFVSSWRRMTAERASFAKDAFYTMLSTGINSIIRHVKLPEPEPEVLNLVKHCFVKRLVLSLSVSQPVAERCSDLKNLIMHSFSEYSCTADFILDKFAPPYKNAMEAWIVSCVKKAGELCAAYQSGTSVKLKQPVYVGMKRHKETIGGYLNLPSIYGDVINKDPQDLLDDLYLYVLTPKEPSNIHHENVKSVKTILKFQSLFDELTQSEKDGELKTSDDIKKHILKQTSVGFSRDILHHSVLHTLSLMTTAGIKNRIDQVIAEPILNLSSTKSCIPETDRHPEKEWFKSKRVKNRIYLDENGKKIDKNYASLKLTSKPNYLPINTGTNRMKVHDCITDLFSKQKMNTIFELAQWNIEHNNSRVVTDICIKAQYGAKREFYVVNLGAKAMMRLMENCFKELCKSNPNEMISIPGDKKLLHMQEKVNNLMVTKTSGKTLYSINGDCTKWSAAETLQSFDQLTLSASDVFGEELTGLLRHICFSWANKIIQIPPSIARHTQFFTDQTQYLKDNQTQTIKSTQNFLQGMMNYASSFKAVCCSNYTYKIWKELNPMSKLTLEHLEHSDDYVLMLRVSSKDELLKFRILHRIMMKLHGFNDSVKKTNTQKLLTEFISLIAFNGQMIYPQIKKIKEVGMNVGCTGYKNDIDTALSRSAEAFRNGCTIESSYIMQRIHLVNVCRSYSLLQGMENSFADYDELMDTPIELFGIPDILPNIYMMTSGNCNNYRISKFVKTINGMSTTLVFKNLLSIGLKAGADSALEVLDDPLYETHLYHPKYSYDQESKLIKEIRKALKISFEETLEFLDNNKSYLYMKPTQHELSDLWLHTMYYKPNFAIAYSRVSRAQLTLRISRLVRNKCILKNPNEEDSELLTIKEYNLDIWNKIRNLKIENDSEMQILLDRILNSHDPSLDILYGILTNAFLENDKQPRRVLSAVRTPNKPKWVDIENPINTIFQYLFDKKNLFRDNRHYRGLVSLERDKEKLEGLYGIRLNEQTPRYICNVVYKDLHIFKNKQNIAMSYIDETNNFEDFFIAQIESQTVHDMKYKLITRGIVEAANPYTRQTFFKKHMKMESSLSQVVLDDIVLICSYLLVVGKKTVLEVKELLKQIKFHEKLAFNFPSVLEFIQGIDFDIAAIKMSRPYELKSIAWLKWVFADEESPMLKLMDTFGQFIYRYRNKSNYGETVDFEYQGCRFTAWYHKHTGKVLIGSTQLTKHKFKVAYIIALKLFNLIKQYEFETQLSQLTMKNVNTFDYSTFESIKEDLKIPDCNILNSNWVVTNNGECTPFLTNIPYFGGHLNKTENLPRSVTYDDANLTFYMANMKFFTVPVLQCRQLNVLEYSGDETILSVKMSWFLKKGRMEKLLKNDDIIKDDKQLLDNLNIETFNFKLTDSKLLYSRLIQFIKNKPLHIDREKLENSYDDSASNLDLNDLMRDDLSDMMLDFEVMEDEEDLIEIYESESSTSASESSGNGTDIFLKDIVNLQPFFMPVSRVQVFRNTPQTISKLKNCEYIFKKYIAESTWHTSHMYNLPYREQLTLCLKFIKFFENYCQDRDELFGLDALTACCYTYLIESFISFQIDEPILEEKGNQQIIKVQGSMGLYYKIEDPPASHISRALSSDKHNVLILKSHSSLPTGVYFDKELEHGLSHEFGTNVLFLPVPVEKMVEVEKRMLYNKNYFTSKFDKIYNNHTHSEKSEVEDLLDDLL